VFKQHVDTIGIVLLVWGALQIGVSMLFVLPSLLYAGLGVLMMVIGASEGDEDAMIGGLFMGGLGVFMLLPAVFIGLMAALSMGSGWGVLKRMPWARMGGVVAGALSTMQCFPVGALVGVFSILVLLDSEVGKEFTPAPTDAPPPI
jgi:hypothetical protein